MNAPRKRSTPLWWTGLKLLGCGAIIALIGFAMTVIGTTGSVSESHADITWFSPFDRSNTERLERSLDNLGHDEPQRYDLNGNTVFFSTHRARKSPRQLMAEYQEEFRRQGLNDDVFVTLSDEQRGDRLETKLTGGIVPFVISDDKVVMRGAVTANQATNREELARLHEVADHPQDIFRAHRHIEISRSPHERHSSIVATWSDESFDFQRMIPGSHAEGQSFDTTVPTCPNCTRLTRFADDNPGQNDRTILSFIGPQTIDVTRHFYAQRLPQSGWQRQSLDEALDPIERQFGLSLTSGETDRYIRDGQSLSLSFINDDSTNNTLVLASLTGS